ncbi:MAG TPA: glucose-6-phosphate isomerase [Cyanobacteria bacterium UBA11162]|nr:glucose-6-phosphate isomerase [Cyanobacteria bacterium UBA11162]
MSYKQIPPDFAPTKSFPSSLQPAPAWTAILGLIFFSAACIVLGAGKILNLAFPLGAFTVGVLLYFRYPILYLGFTWWIWFLTPLIRRLADYRGDFTNPSPILLAPYLVTLLTLVTLWRYLPKADRQAGLPFILSLVGVFYGFLIGLIQVQPVAVCIALLDWLAPVLFGFHLFINWRNYPSYRQTILRVFIWGVLLTGVYGVWQYLIAPPWDKYWMTKVDMASVGKPQPLGIRVWSTANAPGPFANFMRAGLLVLFSSRGTLRIPASVAGYLAFLLTLVRSAWVSWFLGLISLTSSVSTKLKIRLIIAVLVMAVLVVPLATIEPFSSQIGERVETLSNLEDDKSANTRQETYSEQLGSALTSFVGMGIGNKSYDSAILTALFNLGWLGTLPYITGILLLSFSLFQSGNFSFDPFVGASQAIVLGSLAQLPLGSPMVELKGMLLWGFLGIGMAAIKYYRHQQMAELNES